MKDVLPMPQEPSDQSRQSGLIIRRDAELAILPNAASSALNEIISKSLAHIQTCKTLTVPERKGGEEREFEIAPGVKIVMCWIPPGEFLMGSSEKEDDRRSDETQHFVKITKGFWLSKTQITQAQWIAVMGNNPSYSNGEELPVERVSWNDICGNETRTGGFLGAVNKTASEGERFDLPTEAQWEYACRAGTTGPYYANIDEIAWYKENSGGKTHPVAKQKPNAWGLHDMHGNVWEWCSDWYGAYDVSASIDPDGTASGSRRVGRGGDWHLVAGYCRAATRKSGGPDGSYDYVGFRLVRCSVPAAPNAFPTASSGRTRMDSTTSPKTSAKPLNATYREKLLEACRKEEARRKAEANKKPY